MNKIDLSLVFPVYNEQDMLPLLRKSLDHFFLTWESPVEFVLVNDGSTDLSLAYIKNWMKQDPRVTLVDLNENQGHQKALYRGMIKAAGQWVVTLDADLQDPLDQIPYMLEQAQAGFDVVHMRRTSREGEILLKKAAAWTFYRTIKFVHEDVILDSGDFRMMSKNAIDHLARNYGPNAVLRISVPRLKLPQTTLEYARKPRVAGKSKFTLMKLVQLANQARK